jgi:hypothetical protein
MRPEAPLFLPTPRVARRPRSLAPTDAAVVLQPHLRRHRVITGERAPYLRSFTPLTRAPSHRYSSRSTASAIDGRPVNLPSAFTPCFRHVPISSKEPVGAYTVARCLELSPPRRSSSPPQPPPPATTAHPRWSPARAVQPPQSTLGEPLGGPAPLVGQARPSIAAGEPTRRQEGRNVRIEIFPGAYVQGKGICVRC